MKAPPPAGLDSEGAATISDQQLMSAQLGFLRRCSPLSVAFDEVALTGPRGDQLRALPNG